MVLPPPNPTTFPSSSSSSPSPSLTSSSHSILSTLPQPALRNLSPSHCPLLALPTETHLQILSFLRPRDLYVLRVAHRYFYGLIRPLGEKELIELQNLEPVCGKRKGEEGRAKSGGVSGGKSGGRGRSFVFCRSCRRVRPMHAFVWDLQRLKDMWCWRGMESCLECDEVRRRRDREVRERERAWERARRLESEGWGRSSGGNGADPGGGSSMSGRKDEDGEVGEKLEFRKREVRREKRSSLLSSSGDLG